MATQNKTKTEKVWVVKDGDGVEVYRAEAKKDLLAGFYDAVRDYFEGGTVWEDERFLLVLPDGEIYEIPDFKNITHAKKLAQKAVAIFYNGSSDLAAWINPKRVTPEAEKAIGKFELIEREFVFEVSPKKKEVD